MKRQRQEGGYVLVTVGVALVALIGMVALAIDVGYLYSKRANYQRAADAAALAGAFTYVVEPKAQQPNTATDHAIATAIENPAMGSVITAGQVSVTFPAPPISGDHLVKVDIQAPSPTFFAQIFGITSANIIVSATAEVALSSPTGAMCVKPWFIPNTVLAQLNPGPNLDSCVTCTDQNKSTSKLLLAGTQAAGFKMTNYASLNLGTRLQIKPQSPQSRLTSGQFYAIDFSGSTGGSDYRTNIGTCVSGTVSCLQVYPTKQGNMVGPTTQGVSDLVGTAPDTYMSLGQYQLFSGATSDTSHQLVLVPVWDTCNSGGSTPGTPNFCPDESFPSGSTNLRVLGFALMFVEGMDKGGNVMGRLINIVGCQDQPTLQGQAPYAIPIRLVKQ